jgi:hypothetical protein
VYRAASLSSRYRRPTVPGAPNRFGARIRTDGPQTRDEERHRKLRGFEQSCENAALPLSSDSAPMVTAHGWSFVPLIFWIKEHPKEPCGRPNLEGSRHAAGETRPRRRAKSDGGLPVDADPADLARYVGRSSLEWSSGRRRKPWRITEGSPACGASLPDANNTHSSGSIVRK